MRQCASTSGRDIARTVGSIGYPLGDIMARGGGNMSGNRLRGLHFLSALAIGLFLVVHLGNHLYGLAGQQAHVDYMGYARTIYRNRVVEVVLLALFAWQLASGLTMLVRRWKQRRGAVAWLQALSGLYLAFFLLAHVGAVMAGRGIFGLDTDFRFAAAGFSVPPLQLLFAPYYFLAVFCLFAHVGCAVYWRLGSTRDGVLAAFVLTGGTTSLLIVLSLAGVLYPVDIPDAYKATFGG